jgi:hypothetical protein
VMRLPVACLVVFAISCAPNPQAPVSVMALLYGSNSKLGPKQTTLDTVKSVVKMQGSVVTLLGGGGITIDPNDMQQQNLLTLTDQQLIDALYTTRGGDVHANLIDKSGVLWPADFHSWSMVTTYWNFEQAFAYFNQIYDGEKTDHLAAASVLYWGNYTNLAISDPDLQTLTDNIIYYSPVRVFVVAPFQRLDKVPVSMNLGIVGHEFAHRVFNQKAYGDHAVPPQLGWEGAPLNILEAVDEGLADFHGYGVTCVAKDGPGCSTRFLAASFDDTTLVDKRDFSRGAQNCMTESLRTAINNLDSDTFAVQSKQYDLGTLFAASLYQAANKGGKLELMQKALIRAYDDDSSQTPGLKQFLDANLATSEKLTLEAVSDIIISHVTDPDLKRLVCNELWDRLDLQPTQIPLPHCPPTSMRGTTCTPLPPP